MHRRVNDEGGVIVVLVALTATVVLIFVAFAVDIGLVANQRRQDQTAADAAALAAGNALLEQVRAGDAYDPSRIVAVVQDVSWENLQPGVDEAAWRARWPRPACVDPDRPAGYTDIVSGIECISVNAAVTRVRVRIPDIDVETQFGRAADVDRFRTSAFAEVELVPTGFAGVLPFGLPGASANQNEVCLKDGDAGSPPNTSPCDGATTGNFGPLDISLFGNPVLGTPEMCGNDSAPLKLIVNTALGVDHLLSEYPTAPPDPLPTNDPVAVNDHAVCPDLSSRPNVFPSQTGNIAPAVEEGLIKGPSAARVANVALGGRSIPGRLTRSPFADVWEAQAGYELDDRPLWDYLGADATRVPASCDRARFTGTAAANKGQLLQCLTDFKAPPPPEQPAWSPLFTADADGDSTPDIAQSVRFAFVPQLWRSTYDTGNSNVYPIERFRPVFLQKLFFSCSGKNPCRTTYEPGDHSTPQARANDKAEALTALLLTDAMLPPAALANRPGASGHVTRQLVLRR